MAEENTDEGLLDIIISPPDLKLIREDEAKAADIKSRAEARQELTRLNKELVGARKFPFNYAGSLGEISKRLLAEAGWEVTNVPLNDPLAGPGTYPKWELKPMEVLDAP